jgi:hypothetical protein
MMIPFTGVYDVRYIRILNDETGANSGALCEFEVFAVPPPVATEVYID